MVCLFYFFKIFSILGYFIFYLFIFILLKIMEKEKKGYFLLKQVILSRTKAFFVIKKSLMQICQTRELSRNCYLKSNGTKSLCHFALISLIKISVNSVLSSSSCKQMQIHLITYFSELLRIVEVSIVPSLSKRLLN